MKWVYGLSRWFLGLVYLAFGLNGFFNVLPTPPLSAPAQEFFAALVRTGYMEPLWKGCEVLLGLSLIANLWTPFWLVIVAPVTVNIVCFHLFLDRSTLPIAAGLGAAHFALLFKNRRYYRPMLSARSAVIFALIALGACSNRTVYGNYQNHYSGAVHIAALGSDVGFDLQWNESASQLAAGVYQDDVVTFGQESALTGGASSSTQRDFTVTLSGPNASGVAALRISAQGALGGKLSITLTALNSLGNEIGTGLGKAIPGAGHTTKIATRNLAGKLACAVDIDWTTPATAHPGVVALLPDGTLKSWGDNDQHAIGQGTSTIVASPTTLALPAGAKALWVAQGKQFGAAIDRDHKLYYWGHFVYPYTTVVTPADPTEITGLSFTPLEVYAAQDALFVIDDQARVWAVGSDALGQQGNAAATSDNANFTEITALAGTSSLATWGYSGTVFAIKDGALYSWGDSTDNKDAGTHGDAGPFPTIETPTRVLGTFSDISRVSLDNETGLAIRTSGEVYTFGKARSSANKLGRSGGSEPALVALTAPDAFISGMGPGTLLRDPFGDIYSMGTNLFGAFGLGAVAASDAGTIPTLLAEFPDVSAVQNCGSATFAVKGDGGLWAAGRQQYGNLGDGQDNAANVTSFVAVPGVSF